MARIRHIGTGVFRHLISERRRVHRGEPKPDGSAPAFGDFGDLNVDALVGQDNPIAEHQRLAETLRSSGDKFVLLQLYVWTVHVVKLNRRQVILAGNQERLWNGSRRRVLVVLALVLGAAFGARSRGAHSLGTRLILGGLFVGRHTLCVHHGHLILVAAAGRTINQRVRSASGGGAHCAQNLARGFPENSLD